MFRRNLVPVWIGIIFVASAFLMGANPIGCEPGPVPKTGQTTSYTTGDDGDLQRGVAWPVPRFADNLNGTVTDNLTGLVWTKDADCHSGDWQSALDYCNALADGTCGLTDGSSVSDWRLTNVKELQSLIDFEYYDPALPSGHPFTDVQFGDHSGDWYWSSTTGACDTNGAWVVFFGCGDVFNSDDKDGSLYAWCVRGGHGHNAY